MIEPRLGMRVRAKPDTVYGNLRSEFIDKIGTITNFFGGSSCILVDISFDEPIYGELRWTLRHQFLEELTSEAQEQLRRQKHAEKYL